MTYIGCIIIEDTDFDGVKVFAVENRDGSFSDFPTMAEARAYIRALQPRNW